MGAFRLARDSELSQDEAKEFIETYFQRFPDVKRYLDETKVLAMEQGYVETLLGRRRYFPIFKDERANRGDLARAEREAINMPIQGTAADIIKIAMIRLYNALQERGLRSEMILQVHDELVLEVPDDEVEEVAALVRETMEGAFPMDIPLRVDVNIGSNWGQMK
jgi:DNA polymerase-1